MTYATLDLSLTVDEARDRIADHVDGISVRRVDDGYEFLSPVGFRLAALSPARLPDGREGSRLVYRTTLLSPSAAHARRLAREIRSTVEEMAVARK